LKRSAIDRRYAECNRVNGAGLPFTQPKYNPAAVCCCILNHEIAGIGRRNVDRQGRDPVAIVANDRWPDVKDII
jgi:hypothetical protein